MNLTDLKRKPVGELIDMAREMGLDNLARSRKQEVIAAIVRKQAKNGEDIFGEGTLEILQDGFGFLRSPDSSYLAGPDDIYVSPSQIRRFNLRTGDNERTATLPQCKAYSFSASEAASDPVR